MMDIEFRFCYDGEFEKRVCWPMTFERPADIDGPATTIKSMSASEVLETCGFGNAKLEVRNMQYDQTREIEHLISGLGELRRDNQSAADLIDRTVSMIEGLSQEEPPVVAYFKEGGLIYAVCGDSAIRYVRHLRQVVREKDEDLAALTAAMRLSFWSAPGDYQCTCGLCGATFVGDKRARMCTGCADKRIREIAARFPPPAPPPPPSGPVDFGADVQAMLKDAAMAMGTAVERWTVDEGYIPIAVLSSGALWQPLYKNRLTDCVGDAARLALNLGLGIGIAETDTEDSYCRDIVYAASARWKIMRETANMLNRKFDQEMKKDTK
jgi:hypothetical protein